MKSVWASCCIVSGVLLTIGCGTKKTVSKNILISPTAVAEASVQDTLVLNSKEVLEINKNTAPAVVLKEPEDEALDKLQVQKQGGIYKSADWATASHYDLRKPNYVIIHHTSQKSVAQTIRTFQVPHTKVSAHYVIGKDGQIVQMLNDYDRAWHAGRAKWGSVTDINSASIGIELDNDGFAVFPEEQINSLLILLDTLKSKYLIPQVNFIGHADIAPTRKNDPNVNFPWKKLADKGFGIWYNEDYLMKPPSNFNPIDALKIMGYDMRNPEAAIEAFKRKYIVKEVNKKLNEYDIRVLYDLYRKYY